MVDTPAPVSPREAGVMSKWLAKAMANMSPQDRSDFIADAAASSSEALAKAAHEMETMDPNDHGPFHMVEDQWNGPPDGALETTRAYGPGAKVVAGDVPIGPRQQASGDGAIIMERQYSDPAKQRGVEEATNRLGRALAKSVFPAIKSLHAFGEAMAQRVNLLESTMLAPPPALDDTVISKAIAKAIPGIVRQTALAVSKSIILAKAEEEEEEEEGGEEEEEVAKAENAAITKSEIDVEIEDEEGDKDDEGEKEAAKARIIAKSLFALARRALRKAKKHEEAGEAKESAEETSRARYRMGKARIYLEVAKSIRGKAGPSTLGLAKAIKAAVKEMKPQAKNQTNWADAAKPGVAKAEVTSGDVSNLASQIDVIRKAVEGVGMLQTNMAGMLDAIARSPANPDSGLPPVFALAKAKPQQLDTAETQINQMASDKIISLDDRDRAFDVLRMAKRGVPTVDVMALQLPPEVQNTLRNVLAA